MRDELYAQACAIVLLRRDASISLVQRRLRIGYRRAVVMLTRMECDGLVSAPGPDGRRRLR